MIYLEKADYFKQIKVSVLDEIIEDNEFLIEEVTLIAVQELRSYLVSRYDIDVELKKTPPEAGNKDTRNVQIVMWCVDIALYHLHSRINPRNIPELRIIRYDGNDSKQMGGALGALKMASKGTITLDLPEYDEDDDISVGLVFDTDGDFESRPFSASRRRSLGEHRLVKTHYPKS